MKEYSNGCLWILLIVALQLGFTFGVIYGIVKLVKWIWFI